MRGANLAAAIPAVRTALGILGNENRENLEAVGGPNPTEQEEFFLILAWMTSFKQGWLWDLFRPYTFPGYDFWCSKFPERLLQKETDLVLKDFENLTRGNGFRRDLGSNTISVTQFSDLVLNNEVSSF